MKAGNQSVFVHIYDLTALNTLRLLFLEATNVSDFNDFEKIANIKYSLKLVVFLNM